MSKLSVVITAHNSQDFIKDCIKSVKFADQVIVVNNESTDDTAQIAKDLKAKVINHTNNPAKLNQSKNFGFTKASGDWILSLDTDERIETTLAEEIKQLLNLDPTTQPQGFFIPRQNIIFGKWIKHGLWYPDHQLRLFKKGQGEFPNVHNHERLEVKGQTAYLKNHLIHHNYQTISQYIQKIDKMYSDNEAEVFLKNGHKLHWHDAIRFPFQDFLANYFSRQAYKDGLHGLVLSLLQSFYMFIVFCKIWEKQDFKEKQISLPESKKEFNRFTDQLKYWFIHEQAKDSNPFKKLYFKIKSIF